MAKRKCIGSNADLEYIFKDDSLRRSKTLSIQMLNNAKEMLYKKYQHDNSHGFNDPCYSVRNGRSNRKHQVNCLKRNKFDKGDVFDRENVLFCLFVSFHSCVMNLKVLRCQKLNLKKQNLLLDTTYVYDVCREVLFRQQRKKH